ncbi:MAG: helicase-related protein, partial [Verrucomicrobiota bacterium]
QEIAFEQKEREHLKNHGNAAKHPRKDWLLEFIKKNKNEKILLICRYKDRAEALFEGISSRLNIKMTVFHEDLSLMQRDRNAAWFSDEDGAQLLLCSEIGSEGRNFQFAHHLVLFDLPLDPELLEQRIGRLDRIGQGSTIHLHVPYIKGTSQELLFRWFHEGINAFEEQVQGGALFVENFYSQLRKFLLAPENASEDFNKLIEDTSTFRSKLKDKLKRGRDRLLELQSFQPAKADEIIHELQQLDLSRELDRYLLNMFDHYGIHVEELSDRLWLLQRGQMLTDKLTLIPEQGKLITLQRSTAVKRDDVEFMTWDHPMLSSIADMMLGSDSGNASFVQVRASDCELSKDIFFEIIYVLEAVCPEGIDIKQFMPLTPFRIFCNHKNKSLSHSEASKLLEADKTDAPAQSITENLNIIKDMLRATTTYALELAEVEAASLRKAAQEIMQATYSYELDRMLALHQIKGTVNELEIKSLTEERKALDKGIDTSTIRMDSIRMYQII